MERIGMKQISVFISLKQESFFSKTGLDMHPNRWKVLHFSEDAPKRGGSCKIQ